MYSINNVNNSKFKGKYYINEKTHLVRKKIVLYHFLNINKRGVLEKNHKINKRPLPFIRPLRVGVLNFSIFSALNVSYIVSPKGSAPPLEVNLGSCQTLMMEPFSFV